MIRVNSVLAVVSCAGDAKRPNHVRRNHREQKLSQLFTESTEKMGRGYGGAILALVELCLLMALTAQDVDAYPHRTYHSTGNVDHYVDNSGRSFQPTFVRRQTRDNVERLNEKALEPERLDSNDRLHGRARRDVVKPQPRSFIGLRKQVPSEEEMQSDGKIVFPGQMNQNQNHQVPSCKGSTYCVTADNYPEDLVNNAIQQNGNLKYLASVDIIPDVVITNRLDVTDEVPLCLATEHVIYPQGGETKDNQWKFIVNQDNFKQGVRIEECVTENASCSAIGGLAEGYKTSCKQKYVYRQLASILTNGTVIQDNFRFASSCCCHVSFTPNTRMGVNIQDQTSQVSPAKTRRRK